MNNKINLLEHPITILGDLVNSRAILTRSDCCILEQGRPDQIGDPALILIINLNKKYIF
jgi:hypothetical protein